MLRRAVMGAAASAGVFLVVFFLLSFRFFMSLIILVRRCFSAFSGGSLRLVPLPTIGISDLRPYLSKKSPILGNF